MDASDQTPSDQTRNAVMEHLAAFNAHDSARLVSGLADDIVWATGTDVIQGRAATAALFDEGLWALQPNLALVRLIADGVEAAAECVERLTIDGAPAEFPIGVFFSVRDGLLSRVRVFREGSADV